MPALRQAYFALAAITLALVVLQFFLAGLGLFGATSGFDAHRTVGFIASVPPLLMLVAALAGGLGRPAVIFGGGIFALMMVQAGLPQASDGAPVIAALHPVLALVVFMGSLQAVQHSAGGRRVQTR